MQKEKSQNNFYINREISWIHFNKRVLELAIDTRTPLLEKLKFSAIFSNNLDEFFMVRVASLKSQIEAGISKKSEDGLTPKEQLIQIREKLAQILTQQQKHYIYDLKRERPLPFNLTLANLGTSFFNACCSDKLRASIGTSTTIL